VPIVVYTLYNGQINSTLKTKNSQINYGRCDTSYYARDKNHKGEHHLQNGKGSNRNELV